MSQPSRGRCIPELQCMGTLMRHVCAETGANAVCGGHMCSNKTVNVFQKGMYTFMRSSVQMAENTPGHGIQEQFMPWLQLQISARFASQTY